MSAVFDVLELSGEELPVAEPPQAVRANRTASPAAAVWILVMFFKVFPCKSLYS
jgi:hypothetical protein